MREELELKGDYRKDEIEKILRVAVAEFSRNKTFFDPDNIDDETPFFLNAPVREDMTRKPRWGENKYTFSL